MASAVTAPTARARRSSRAFRSSAVRGGGRKVPAAAPAAAGAATTLTPAARWSLRWHRDNVPIVKARFGNGYTYFCEQTQV